MKVHSEFKLPRKIEPDEKMVKIIPDPSKRGSNLHGLGKRHWLNIDAVRYIQSLRQDRII